MLEKSERCLEKHSLGLIDSVISAANATTSSLNARVGEEFMVATQIQPCLIQTAICQSVNFTAFGLSEEKLNLWSQTQGTLEREQQELIK